MNNLLNTSPNWSLQSQRTSHASDHLPPASFGWPGPAGLCRLQRAPAGRWPFPALSLQSLPGCPDPYPAASLRCLPVSSQRASASPYSGGVRHAERPSQCNFNDDFISGLQSFANVRAPMLARPSGCTDHCGFISAGPPGRLHHAGPMPLPYMSSGIATCLKRAIGTAGLSPAGLQHCRLLSPVPEIQGHHSSP